MLIWCWSWYDADADADAHTYYSRHQPPKRKGLRSLRDPSALDRTWPLSSSAFALIRTFHFYRRGDKLACLERFLIWAKYQHWGQRYSNKNISFHQKQGRACLFGKWGLRRWWSIDALSQFGLSVHFLLERFLTLAFGQEIIYFSGNSSGV